MTPPVVLHADYDAALEPSHRFPMAKYRALAARLEAGGLLGRRITPEPATAALLERAHDPAYVARALGLALTDAEQRRLGLPRSAAVLRRARLAASGTLAAAESALEAGLALNAAGGSHHADRDGGAGFSTFNDVAVAALELMARRRVVRVLVVDLDVHQGDGTARIFEGDDRVFTLSLHAERNWPTRKARSSLDVGLPDGTADAAYLAALAAALEIALAAGPFDLAFYNAGVDVHAADRLGRLAVSDAGLRARDADALGRLRDAGLPVAAVLGGGYDDDAEAVAARHAILFEEAARRAEIDACPSPA